MAAGPHILAVGDIHGRADLLARLLGEVLPQTPAQTRLVFLGDYIDRGPDSAQVVEALIVLKARLPETVFLMGNHEWMLLEALAGRHVDMYLLNGGWATLDSYGLGADSMHCIPAGHLDFLNSLEYFFETEGHIYVHAGLKPGRELDEQEPRDMLWIREQFFYSPYDFGKVVVFGHTPFSRPFEQPGRIGIDTGAVYGGRLTCLKLPEREFFLV